MLISLRTQRVNEKTSDREPERKSGEKDRPRRGNCTYQLAKMVCFSSAYTVWCLHKS